MPLNSHEKQYKQAFREFLVSLALISNLNGHKSVDLVFIWYGIPRGKKW